MLKSGSLWYCKVTPDSVSKKEPTYRCISAQTASFQNNILKNNILQQPLMYMAESSEKNTLLCPQLIALFSSQLNALFSSQLNALFSSQLITLFS